MKTNFKKALLLIAISITVFSANLHAQAIYKVDGAKDNDMKLSGTSTFHNWSMNAPAFTSQAQFIIKPGSTQITAVKALSFSLMVANLKSGESGLDNNAYKALKSDQYKTITYTLNSAAIVSVKGNKTMVKTTGNLTISGVTKQVTMNVGCTINKDGSITCTGSDDLKMTDYNVKPPSFMLGVMKTGDAITLDFTIDYKK
jgi:polyisoprenoid-binding protein YceI